jgi:hypothetical protein
MINASWLRNWLYHGQHLLFGVAWLRPVLRGDSGAIAYSHQITAASDSGPLLFVCMGFLLIAAVEVGFVAVCMGDEVGTQPGDHRPGGGGQPDPEPAPDRPGGPRLADTADDDLGLVLGAISVSEAGPRDEQDRVLITTNISVPVLRSGM